MGRNANRNRSVFAGPAPLAARKPAPTPNYALSGDPSGLRVLISRRWDLCSVEQVGTALGRALVRLGCRVMEVDGKAPLEPVPEGFSPDLYLAIWSSLPEPDAVGRLKCPKAYFTTDDPYVIDFMPRVTAITLGKFDIVYTNEANCVGRYKGGKHLLLGYDPEWFVPGDAEKRWDVTFVGNGTLAPRPPFLLAAEKYCVERKLSACFHDWRRVPGLPRWLDQAGVADVYRRSRIVLNIHRASDDPRIRLNSRAVRPTHCNPRVFEASAVGAFQLSDGWRDEMERIFPCIPIYRSEAEMVSLIDHYLSDDAERERIGALCSEYAKGHSYTDRALSILEDFGLSPNAEGDA